MRSLAELKCVVGPSPFVQMECEMQDRLTSFACSTALAFFVAGTTSPAHAGPDGDRDDRGGQQVQLGPRPFYLVDGMDSGVLKTKLSQCKAGPFHRADFSIGHRGAALQFPEQTKGSQKRGDGLGRGTFSGEP